MPKSAQKIIDMREAVTAAKEVRIEALLTEVLGKETHASVNNKFGGMVNLLGNAKMAIDQKYMEIGGDTGNPVGGVEYGAGDGYRRRYQNGMIYFLPPGGPCWVHGSILDKYLSLGGEGGFLGYPTTDELTTPGGAGRYNHFERGSIYWTYGTGAHEVHGGIRDKWASLGWEQGSLGFPKSDEKAYEADGRVSEFEHGCVFWWPDTGAIDLADCAVRYKGLYCFGRTDGLGSDSPYAIFGTAAVPPVKPSAVRSQIYDDVDSGDSRPDQIEIYRGLPGGMAIGAWLFEHDSGDPDKYLDLVKQGVALAGKGVAEGCGALLGPDAVPICQAGWGALAPEIVNVVNGLIGSGDDPIGDVAWVLTAKDMITSVGVARKHFWGIDYVWESGLFSRLGATYKVYLDIVRV